MPIVKILALPPKDSNQIDDILTEVARKLAAALDTTPNNVWVHFVPLTHFCEGESVPAESVYHPVITVLANPRPEELIKRGLQAVATAVAAGLELPLENIWIHWVDLPPGRVYADGKVR
jgi:phenylpyruvate tautomerase PptA (4-oxalocrotonate tautomerase family)